MTFTLNEVGNPWKDFVFPVNRLWWGKGEKKGDQREDNCNTLARNTDDLDQGGIGGSN